MRKTYIFALLALVAAVAPAQDFDKWFCDSTLRLCYTFAGDAQHQSIYIDELRQSPHWYGRRNHLDELPLAGNGDIVVKDKASGKVIYKHSFSSLFQEWVATDEAKTTPRSFENVYLIPKPKNDAEVTVTLRDSRQNEAAKLTHIVRHDDILIARDGEKNVTPYITLHPAKDSLHCINVAIVAEGYTMSDMGKFLKDCNDAIDALMAHEPFKSRSDCFNVVAVLNQSHDSGVSIPHNNDWRNTSLGSHFDTFYITRYLTTLHLKQMHNTLAGVPYEHIIVLANTDTYGGGGIYNSYTLSYTGSKFFKPVVVHEFGHSFGGLGDEYNYGNEVYFYPDIEPWEQNITTLKDFDSKWKDMLPADVKIPTKPIEDPATSTTRLGVFEGAGYMEKGVFRPTEDCRMRSNRVPEFCPVCQRAITRVIDFYCK